MHRSYCLNVSISVLLRPALEQGELFDLPLHALQDGRILAELFCRSASRCILWP